MAKDGSSQERDEVIDKKDWELTWPWSSGWMKTCVCGFGMLQQCRAGRHSKECCLTGASMKSKNTQLHQIWNVLSLHDFCALWQEEQTDQVGMQGDSQLWYLTQWTKAGWCPGNQATTVPWIHRRPILRYFWHKKPDSVTLVIRIAIPKGLRFDSYWMKRLVTARFCD